MNHMLIMISCKICWVSLGSRHPSCRLWALAPALFFATPWPSPALLLDVLLHLALALAFTMLPRCPMPLTLALLLDVALALTLALAFGFGQSLG